MDGGRYVRSDVRRTSFGRCVYARPSEGMTQGPGRDERSGRKMLRLRKLAVLNKLEG